MTFVCAVVYFVEEDHGSGDDGKASSAEGKGEEDRNGSAGVEGKGSVEGGIGSACADDVGSVDGSVGSDQGGKGAS
jgi:hypothetical protein